LTTTTSQVAHAGDKRWRHLHHITNISVRLFGEGCAEHISKRVAFRHAAESDRSAI
jgi:hypothetical protein